MSTHKTIEYVYTNPNQLEGDCYSVAEAAFEQAASVFDLGLTALDDAYKMARVAEMERELVAVDDCDGAEFDNTALGRAITRLKDEALVLRDRVKRTSIAAGYDPKHPPKELPAA